MGETAPAPDVELLVNSRGLRGGSSNGRAPEMGFERSLDFRMLRVRVPPTAVKGVSYATIV